MAELREGQELDVAASPRTAGGHPAAYQTGSAVWESSNPAVATVTADPNNELNAVVKGVDGSNNESVVISLSADGDPDADQTRDVIGTADITVTQGEAFVFDLTTGTPRDAGSSAPAVAPAGEATASPVSPAPESPAATPTEPAATPTGENVATPIGTTEGAAPSTPESTPPSEPTVP